MKNITKKICIFLCLAVFLLAACLPQVVLGSTATTMRDITAFDLVSEMNVGINVGNSLDSVGDDETTWLNPEVTKELILAYKNAGFNTIRLPVTWYTHMDASGTPETAWFDRVEEVVNWILEEDLYCIINTHHEQSWLNTGVEVDSIKDKFTTLWTAIANRFEQYGDHLLFEGYNEILKAESDWSDAEASDYANANKLSQVFVDAVRATGGNNSKRTLIINTYGALHTTEGFELPTDTVENRLAVEFHCYSPQDFCFTGGRTTWGESTADVKTVESYCKEFSGFVNQNIPVILGEFGAVDKDNTEARIAYADTVARYCKKYGIVPIWWDNGNTGEDKYGIFDRYTYEVTMPGIVSALLTGVQEGVVSTTVAPGTKKVIIDWTQFDGYSDGGFTCTPDDPDGYIHVTGTCTAAEGSQIIDLVNWYNRTPNGYDKIQFTAYGSGNVRFKFGGVETAITTLSSEPTVIEYNVSDFADATSDDFAFQMDTGSKGGTVTVDMYIGDVWGIKDGEPIASSSTSSTTTTTTTTQPGSSGEAQDGDVILNWTNFGGYAGDGFTLTLDDPTGYIHIIGTKTLSTETEIADLLGWWDFTGAGYDKIQFTAYNTKGECNIRMVFDGVEQSTKTISSTPTVITYDVPATTNKGDVKFQLDAGSQGATVDVDLYISDVYGIKSSETTVTTATTTTTSTTTTTTQSGSSGEAQDGDIILNWTNFGGYAGDGFTYTLDDPTGYIHVTGSKDLSTETEIADLLGWWDFTPAGYDKIQFKAYGSGNVRLSYGGYEPATTTLSSEPTTITINVSDFANTEEGDIKFQVDAGTKGGTVTVDMYIGDVWGIKDGEPIASSSTSSTTTTTTTTQPSSSEETQDGDVILDWTNFGGYSGVGFTVVRDDPTGYIHVTGNQTLGATTQIADLLGWWGWSAAGYDKIQFTAYTTSGSHNIRMVYGGIETAATTVSTTPTVVTYDVTSTNTGDIKFQIDAGSQGATVSVDMYIGDVYGIKAGSSSGDSYTVTIDGAESTCSGEFTFPESTAAGFIAYTDGTNYYDANSTIPVTSNKSFTTVSYGELKMEQGASIRLGTTLSGIRFYTPIDTAQVAKLKNMGATVKFGTLIAPKDYLTESALTFDLATGRYADVPYTSTTYFTETGFEGVVGSIVSIKEANIAREFVGRGYVKVTLGSVEKIIYADYANKDIKNNSRSVAFVADAYKNNNIGYGSLKDSFKELVDKWAGAYTLKNNGIDMGKVKTVNSATAVSENGVLKIGMEQWKDDDTTVTNYVKIAVNGLTTGTINAYVGAGAEWDGSTNYGAHYGVEIGGVVYWDTYYDSGEIRESTSTSYTFTGKTLYQLTDAGFTGDSSTAVASTKSITADDLANITAICIRPGNHYKAQYVYVESVK